MPKLEAPTIVSVETIDDTDKADYEESDDTEMKIKSRVRWTKPALFAGSGDEAEPAPDSPKRAGKNEMIPLDLCFRELQDLQQHVQDTFGHQQARSLLLALRLDGACAQAGANCFIAGSGLFAYDDMAQGVKELRAIAEDYQTRAD